MKSRVIIMIWDFPLKVISWFHRSVMAAGTANLQSDVSFLDKPVNRADTLVVAGYFE